MVMSGKVGLLNAHLISIKVLEVKMDCLDDRIRNGCRQISVRIQAGLLHHC